MKCDHFKVIFHSNMCDVYVAECSEHTSML